MRATLSFLFLVITNLAAFSQTLYLKTFGDPKNKPVIFLHGGPGYNAAGFEATTAQPLADQGFFVIVYDRRGEGRSDDTKASFTFEQTFVDLNTIYDQHHLTKAVLIGHSFGGIVATLFADKFPGKVSSVILVGAPVSLQETFKTIINKSRNLYESKGDKVNLNYLSMLENMDPHSMEYASYCFGHAMQNGFYTTPHPNAKAQAVYAGFRQNPLLSYASQMTIEAPAGFHKNEKYTQIDLTPALASVRNKKVKIYGLYGKDDGLYSASQVSSLSNLLGVENVLYLADCSHNVFIEQQDSFLESVKKWAR